MRKIAFPAFAAFFLTTAAAWAADDEAMAESSAMAEQKIELIELGMDTRQRNRPRTPDDAAGLTSSGTKS